jgi:formylglycine-generating enzyme required for sulfatase activity
MWDARYGTSYVDEYSPNPWGFYGMLGNVREICRNAQQTITKGETLVEPQGNASSARRQRGRGGSWNQSSDRANATYVDAVDPWNSTSYCWGVRLCLTIKKTAE